MKKDYNRITTSDMPLDSSFTPQVEVVKEKKTTTKPKINAIGKSTANKTKTTGAQKTQTKTGQSKYSQTKSNDTKLRTKLAKSDGANMLRLDLVEELLEKLVRIRKAIQGEQL